MIKGLGVWTVGIISFLLIGSTVFPDSTVMWLADTSASFSVIRVILILALLGMICTNPPRSKVVRRMLGLVAVLAGVMSVTLFYNAVLPLLDSLVFMQAAVILGISALEYTAEERLAEKVSLY